MRIKVIDGASKGISSDEAHTVEHRPPDPATKKRGGCLDAQLAADLAFVEGLSDGVYGVDQDGLCTFVNAAALRMFGYSSAEEVMGRHMHDVVHHTRPDGTPYQVEACPLLHTLASGRPVRLDYEMLWRKDGTSFNARYSSYPVPGDHGMPSGSIVIVAPAPDSAGTTDSEKADAIEVLWGGEERRRREEELRESEAKLRTLVDTIPQLAWLTGPDGLVEWYNRRWYDYTGSSPEEMVGIGWKSVQHPDHVQRVVSQLNAAFASGADWEDTFPLRGRDGSYRWFLSRAVPIRGQAASGQQGRIIGWFGTNTDITEIREAEEAMAAARDAAEEANRTKSAFIANMSHELRTPLSAIIGYSEMLQEEIEDGAKSSELAADMGKIESNARHLLGLINDVLDLSKIESGKMEVFAETFDVEPLLRDVASSVQGVVEKKGNELVLRLEPGLGSMHSDVTKLRQVILNLLSNAAKFTENGTVTLSALRLSGGQGVDWLVFRVSDTGLGMDDEYIGRLFQRFTQADASTTRKFGGTGLGLSLSKAFGVMLGGDLSVTSAPGEGSTFTVFLPATIVASEGDLPSTAVPTSATSGLHGVKGTVLIIDDDPAQRDLMTRFLGREGFGAASAADGVTGLQLARDLKPVAILLDVTMPGPDGWSVLSALKADPSVSAIPVIMVTFVDERGLASSLGAADYVMKPVRWETFRRVMDRFPAALGPVLLVDDDDGMRHHARSMLERDGWTVIEASNGEDALARVAEAPPQVVLLDLEMPVMDGFAFLQAFRARSGCADVPVVVLTARDLTRDDRRRLQGASEVLSKSVTSLGDLSRQLKAATQS